MTESTPINPQPVNPQQALWDTLRTFTPARIGLGRAGISLPTQACLEFQLAHALARDAVHIALDFNHLADRLQLLGINSLLLQSKAVDQAHYLQRPDLGRLLNQSAHETLKHSTPSSADLVIVIADGLSSCAIEHHAVPFLTLLQTALIDLGYRMPPVCLVKHGRVAVGDPIAEHYGAKLCIVLIGERPGLSSPDSMGLYFTYQAKAGISTDADRNCISNIHARGLSYSVALNKLLYLIGEAERLGLSGVHLKDQTSAAETMIQEQHPNFLLG